jgi:hypothetical protein
LIDDEDDEDEEYAVPWLPKIWFQQFIRAQRIDDRQRLSFEVMRVDSNEEVPSLLKWTRSVDSCTHVSAL